MHITRLSPARKFFPVLGALLGLALLSGCETVKLTNLTPSSLPENPSQIYTFTLRIAEQPNAVSPGTLSPHIIVDGQQYDMKRSALGQGLYEFDYKLNGPRDEFAYYYLVKYTVESNGALLSRESFTGVNRASIARRYVLSLEVNRGPVGARVSVLGRGFTPQDGIYFDNVPARTVYESANSISFFVPALEANRNYPVMLGGATGNSPVGTFRIDESSLSVFPSELNLRKGEIQTLTFTLPNPAPTGGLLLDLTTNVPDSVIMAEVMVPAGSTTVAVNVQGGKPGTGSLFLKGFGAGETTIPVTVR